MKLRREEPAKPFTLHNGVVAKERPVQLLWHARGRPRAGPQTAARSGPFRAQQPLPQPAACQSAGSARLLLCSGCLPGFETALSASDLSSLPLDDERDLDADVRENIAFSALEMFLKAFNLRFGEVEPSVANSDLKDVFARNAPQPIPIKADKSDSRNWSESPVGTRSLSKSLTGHPHNFIVFLIKVLLVIHEKNISSPESGVAGLLRVLMIAKSLEIISRYDYNRDCLIKHHCIRTLMLILEDVILLYIDPSAFDNWLLPTGYTVVYIKSLLFNILLLSLHIFRVCCDPDDMWKAFVINAGDHVPTRNGPRTYSRIDSDSLLHGLDNIQKLLNHINEKSHSEFKLRSQILVTLGSLLAFGSNSCRKRFLESGGCKALIFQMGWPKYLEQQDFNSLNIKKVLQSEFRCQILAWNITIILSRLNSSFFRFFSEYTFVEEIIEWVVFVSTEISGNVSFQSDENTYTDSFPLPETDISAMFYEDHTRRTIKTENDYEVLVSSMLSNTSSPSTNIVKNQKVQLLEFPSSPEIDLLKHILLMPCRMNSNPFTGEEFDDFSNNSLLDSENSPVRQLQSHNEFSVQVRNVLNIFSNLWRTDVKNLGIYRSKLFGVNDYIQRIGHPPLQILVLRMIRDLLAIKLDEKETDSVYRRRVVCFKLMEEMGTIDLLFSKNFFQLSLNESDGKFEKMLYEMFVQFASLSFANFTISESLLKITNKCSAEKQFTIAENSLSVLISILETKKHLTQESLKRMESLRMLAPIIRRTVKDFESNDQTLIWKLFALFDLMLLGSKAMSVYLFSDRLALTLIFELVENPNEKFSGFAIRHVVAAMSVLPVEYPSSNRWGIVEARSSTPSGDDLEQNPPTELLTQFFDCFPNTISSMSAFSLQINLLQGIQRAISFASNSSDRVTIQNAFVSARAFEHILGVLSASILTLNFTTEENSSTKLYCTLCEEVLRTLTSVLSGNDLCKRAFKELHGYETIRVRVFVKHDRNPWEGFMFSMMAMIFDSENWQPGCKMLVRNLEAIDALIDMYQHFDESSQLGLLNHIIDTATMHERNRLLFQRAKMIPKIIKKILPKVSNEVQLQRSMDLIETIALVSLTTSDVKLMLSQLSPHSIGGNSGKLSQFVRKKLGVLERFGSTEKSGLALPFYYDHLLRSTLTIARKKEQDLDFFYFLGNQSGIGLPKLAKWPPSLGFTFLTWFRIDAFSDMNSVSPQNSSHSMEADLLSSTLDPRLFSMLASSGNGAELYIKNQILHYVVIRNGSSSTVSVQDFPLLPNKWYFIAISHTSPSFPWTTQSDVAIYLNGNIRVKAKMHYPNTEVHEYCRIGARAKLWDQKSADMSIDENQTQEPVILDENSFGLHNCFAGQMTSVYFFDEGLTLPYLNAIYKLGAGYSLQFRSKDSEIRTGTGAWNGDPLAFDGTLNSKILVQFHPSATQNDSVCFDVSPRSISTQFVATIKNTITYATKCFRTSVHALGGIEILFPLALHFDLEISPPPYVPDHSVVVKLPPENNDEVEVLTRVTLFLRLLAMLLEDDPVHQGRFIELRAGRLLSMLFQQSHPRNLIMSTLDSMMALIKAQSNGTAEGDDNMGLYESLAFDMRLWATASASVQSEYFQFMQHFVTSNLELVRRNFGISFCLDVIDQFYWYETPEGLPQDMQRIILSHPDIRSVGQIRRSLWSIIKRFVEAGINDVEASRIVQVLWVHNDGKHVSEFLSTLTDLIIDHGTLSPHSSGSNHAQSCNLQKSLLQFGGMDLFLELLGHTDELTRLRTLNLMFEILMAERTSDIWRRKLKFEEPPTNGTFQYTSAMLSRMLERFTLTESTYLMLMQYTLETRLIDLDDGCVEIGSMSNKVIKVPNVLQALLELLSKEIDTLSLTRISLRKRMILDLLSLINLSDTISISLESHTNCEQLRSIDGWQQLLLHLIPGRNLGKRNSISGISVYSQALETSKSFNEPMDETEKGNVTSNETNESKFDANTAQEIDQALAANAEVSEYIYSLFAAILFEAFETDRMAWRLIEETTVMVWISRKDKNDGIYMIRKILSSVLVIVADNAKKTNPLHFSEAKK
ncbi:hypothetical protein HK096_011484, partial [Nowakowskiella sp. JEL0078]